jgi:hypothetical protein
MRVCEGEGRRELEVKKGRGGGELSNFHGTVETRRFLGFFSTS